jgi:hypothetical protein
VRSSCNHCGYLSRGDSLRWEVLPCETVGAGDGSGSADVDQFSRHGHTACLIDGCSQIVVFGGMRCSSCSDGAGAAPLELNDLLLFDPDMLKWCASSSTRHHPHPRLHRPIFAQDPGSPFIRTLPPSPRLSRRCLCSLMHGRAPLSCFVAFCKHSISRSSQAAVHRPRYCATHGSTCRVTRCVISYSFRSSSGFSPFHLGLSGPLYPFRARFLRAALTLCSSAIPVGGRAVA